MTLLDETAGLREPLNIFPFEQPMIVHATRAAAAAAQPIQKSAHAALEGGLGGGTASLILDLRHVHGP